jgi:hypothetical protein
MAVAALAGADVDVGCGLPMRPLEPAAGSARPYTAARCGARGVPARSGAGCQRMGGRRLGCSSPPAVAVRFDLAGDPAGTFHSEDGTAAGGVSAPHLFTAGRDAGCGWLMRAGLAVGPRCVPGAGGGHTGWRRRGWGLGRSDSPIAALGYGGGGAGWLPEVVRPQIALHRCRLRRRQWGDYRPQAANRLRRRTTRDPMVIQAAPAVCCLSLSVPETCGGVPDRRARRPGAG